MRPDDMRRLIAAALLPPTFILGVGGTAYEALAQYTPPAAVVSFDRAIESGMARADRNVEHGFQVADRGIEGASKVVGLMSAGQPAVDRGYEAKQRMADRAFEVRFAMQDRVNEAAMQPKATEPRFAIAGSPVLPATATHHLQLLQAPVEPDGPRIHAPQPSFGMKL